MKGSNSDYLLNFAENVKNIKKVISFNRDKFSKTKIFMTAQVMA